MKQRSSQRRGFLSWQSDATHERPGGDGEFTCGWPEDAVRLLQTGRSAKGYVPRPPMPPFRMTPEDAATVVAYLQSLP